METIEIAIKGERFELSPNFRFIKKLGRITGTGNLLEIIGQVSSMNIVAMASVTAAALDAAGVKKFTEDQLGELLMSGEISGESTKGELKGFEIPVALVTLAIEQLTGDKSQEDDQPIKN